MSFFKPIRSRARRIVWLSPLLLFALLLAGNISIWQRTSDLSAELTHNQSLNTAEQTALRIENLLHERTNDLALLASLWRNYAASERAQRFLADASRLVEQEPAYHVINYVDPQSVIRISAPPGKRPELVGLDLKTLPGREALHQQVRNSATPMASPPMTLTTGRPGTVIWFPIRGEKEDPTSFGGMIAGTFHVGDIVQRAITATDLEEFRIQITLEGTTVHSTQTPPARPAGRLEALGATTDFALLGRLWRVSVHPRPASTLARLPQDNALQFVLNVVLSLLASGLLGVAIVAVDRVRKGRQKLQRSERRLKTMFEAAEALFLHDLDGKILDVNSQACESLGYTREELLAMSVGDIDAEFYSHDHKARHWPELSSGQALTLKGLHRRKDGTTFPVEVRLGLLELENRPLMLALARDITERLQAEQALRESEEQYQHLFNSIADAVFVHDLAGNILDVNHQACTKYRYSREELQQMNAEDIDTSEQAKYIEERIQKLLEEGEITFETVHLDRAKNRIPVETTARPADYKGQKAVISICRDVTERVRAHEALRTNEEMLRNILTASSVGLAHAVDRKIAWANEAMIRLFRFTHKEQYLGQDTALLYADEEEYARVGRITYEKQRASQLIEFDARFRRHDGSLFDGFVRVNLLDPKAPAKGIIVSIIDITERVRAEKALRESEKQYQRLFNSIADAVFVHDLSGGILDVNRQTCTRYGYSREELQQTNIAAIDTPKYAKYIEGRIQKLLENGELTFETVHLDRAKNRIPVEITAKTADYKGQQAIISICRDITERVRAEEALRESEERFRKVFEEGPLGMAVLDPDDRFIRANAALCRMTGYTEEELIQSTFLDITHPEDIDVGKQQAQQLLNGEIPYLQTEKRYLTKQGQTLWINLTASFVSDDGGTPLYKLTMIENITQRVQADEALRQYRDHLEELVAERTAELNQRIAESEQLNRAMTNLLEDLQASNHNLEATTARLEEVNQELDDFAYVISHDLKAPLRGISQLATWVVQDYAHLLDDEGKHKLHLLTDRVGRMHALIDGVLQYSRVGRSRQQARPVDLNPLVRDVIELLAPPAHVHVSIEDPLPVVVGEPTRLAQLFQNLVGNGIKFMDKPEGKVTVGCTDEGMHWQFRVSDNGPGIEPRHHDKIFRLFQTLAPHAEAPQSTGIGLALVKRIVETNGGRVWLESTVREGSTFYFTLPKKEGECT